MVTSPDSILKHEAFTELFKQLAALKHPAIRQYNSQYGPRAQTQLYHDITSGGMVDLRVVQTRKGQMAIEERVEGHWKPVQGTTPADYLNRLKGYPDLASFVKANYT